jgi:hypothetical protein
MTRRLAPVLVVALVCLWPLAATAQDDQTDPPAHISFVDGSALLERDGRPETAPTSMPLLAGDRIRTQSGRVEVLFSDGSALHLDANTVVDFQSDDVVRLLQGQVRLAIAGPAREVGYRVDAPSAWVQINDPGEYRIAIIRGADVELAVLRGAAELVNEQGRSYIRAGERTFAQAGAAPSAPYVFNSAAWDAFDRWSEARRDQRIGASAQYLPEDVRPYTAAFDSYGTWRHEAAYGYVWYPRVAVGWRPYHYGRWVSLRPYGWTWVGHDAWGWPTHHYGRWGFSAGAWFWIPGRHWGPAWVSWAYAPNYVSWCPLGWNNRPVFQINVFNHYGGHRYSPWHAWTAVPRHHFGGSHFAVANAAARFDSRHGNGFVIGTRAPDARVAVGRATPIRSAGYAVPRAGVAAARTSGSERPAAQRSGDERRFPAPARAPRTFSSSQTGNAPAAGSGVNRAVPRQRSAEVQPDASRAATPSTQPPAGVPARGYRRFPDSGARQSADSPVSEAPAGAVRAVPRVRESDGTPSGFRSIAPDRSSIRSDRERAVQPEAAAPPSRSTPPQRQPGEVDVYRATPRTRSAPDDGSAYRSRSVPRTGAPRMDAPAARPEAPQPSYRSAPERRAPSGPPPSAAPSSRPSGGDGGASSGGGGGGGGGSRHRGGSSSSGQGRRRG